MESMFYGTAATSKPFTFKDKHALPRHGTLPGSDVFHISNTPEPSNETDKKPTIPDMTHEARLMSFLRGFPMDYPPYSGDAMKIETDPVVRLSINCIW